MSISLLQKPKRTLSNFSLEQFQKAKQFCRDSFKQYREKYCFQPNWESFHFNKRKSSKYQNKKINQANKVVGARHTYSVQGKRPNQYQSPKDQLKKYGNTVQSNTLKKVRPSTAFFSRNSANKTKQKISVQDSVPQLFQNQTLLNSLQSNELLQKDGKVKQITLDHRNKNKSASLCLSKNNNFLQSKYIVKLGVNDPCDGLQQKNTSDSNNNKSDDGRVLKKVLSVKQNFYNPYNIRPKNPYSKPIKHLRNGSIDQLKQLCRQQRNINFIQINNMFDSNKKHNRLKKKKQSKNNIYFTKNIAQNLLKQKTKFKKIKEF